MMWQKIHKADLFSRAASRVASAHLSTLDVEKRSLFVSISRIFRPSLEFFGFCSHMLRHKDETTQVILTAHANYLITDVFSDAITQFKASGIEIYLFRGAWDVETSNCYFSLHFFALLHVMRATNQNCGMSARHVH